MTGKGLVDKVEEIADDIGHLGSAAAKAASGDIGGALKETKETLDANKDGKLSLQDLKDKKWTFAVLLIAALSWTGGYFADHLGFVQAHWMAIVGMGITGLIGAGIMYLFHAPTTIIVEPGTTVTIEGVHMTAAKTELLIPDGSIPALSPTAAPSATATAAAPAADS